MIAAHLGTRIPLGFVSAVLGVSLVLQVLALGSVSLAQDPASKPAVDVLKGSLDGMEFLGPFGVEDEAEPKEEIFTFKDGRFSSASCLKWGFSPAPYWVRRDAKGVNFLAELVSLDHGTMRFEGVFDGKELNVVAFWKKERWYWTIERTYRYRGRPVKPAK
jgi:hypothetical protein